MSEPIYAIGDIHGRLDELERALEKIAGDGGPNAQIVFLGDYTDRGPDSCRVLDRLIDGQEEGRPWTFLKGNHDRMFAWFMQSPPRRDPYMMISLYWLHERLGGDKTLASYGVEIHPERREKDVHADALAVVPPRHIAFLNGLTLSYQTPLVFFAHAGIRPGVPLPLQQEEDLLWIRQEFHKSSVAHPKLIVHGHTPVAQATHYGNRVNLDSGAGYGHPLSTAVIEGDQVWLLTDDGRQPLLAPVENDLARAPRLHRGKALRELGSGEAMGDNGGYVQAILQHRDHLVPGLKDLAPIDPFDRDGLKDDMAPINGAFAGRYAKQGDPPAHNQALNHLIQSDLVARHLKTHVKALIHLKPRGDGAKLFFGDIDGRDIGNTGRQRKAARVHIRNHHMPRADIPRDSGGHDPYWPGAGHEHVLAHKIKAQRSMHGVPKRVENGADIVVNRVG